MLNTQTFLGLKHLSFHFHSFFFLFSMTLCVSEMVWRKSEENYVILIMSRRCETCLWSNLYFTINLKDFFCLVCFCKSKTIKEKRSQSSRRAKRFSNIDQNLLIRKIRWNDLLPSKWNHWEARAFALLPNKIQQKSTVKPPTTYDKSKVHWVVHKQLCRFFWKVCVSMAITFLIVGLFKIVSKFRLLSFLQIVQVD